MMHVDQIRGGVVESRHAVHVAVLDAEGELVARAGDPDLVTFWRSAAKPFQAVPLVTDGVVERFKISTAELALCCASHSSEPGQVALVRELLAKIGCSERDLLCGAHPPLSERVAQDYATRGVRLTAVYSNCSGKHAGMLALARHHGWPTEFYTRLEHPVQQRLLSEVAEWSGVERSRIGTATDGCGVVCYALPLRHFGRHAPPPRPHRRRRPSLHRADARAPRPGRREGRGRGRVLRAAHAGGPGHRAEGRGRSHDRGGARHGGGAGRAGLETAATGAARAPHGEHAGGDGRGAAGKWRPGAMKGWGSGERGAVP